MHGPLASHVSTNDDLNNYTKTMHETGPIELQPGADGGHQVELNKPRNFKPLFPDPSRKWDQELALCDCGYESLDGVHEWMIYRVGVHFPDARGSI